MDTYVTLFRGMNVGGRNSLSMKEGGLQNLDSKRQRDISKHENASSPLRQQLKTTRFRRRKLNFIRCTLAF